MSVALTQSPTAAFPDRPRVGGGVGLNVQASIGSAGAAVDTDLGVAVSAAHLRLMLHAGDLADGSIMLARGEDVDAGFVVGIVFSPGDRTVSLRLGDATALSSAPLDALPWHHVEASIDADAGSATLWVDGQRVDDATRLTLSAIRRVAWGAPRKHHQCSGTCAIDECVVATSYVGPVVVAPASPHADDPARWVVLYDRGNPESVAFADAYRSRRGVPFANLIALDAPTGETLTAAEYADVAQRVNDYLALNGLTQHVLGVLLGYALPAFVETGPGDRVESAAAWMHTAETAPLPTVNPLAQDDAPTRPTADNLAGLRLTATLDAPTLADALERLDRADDLRDRAMDTQRSTLWFDPYFSDSEFAASATQQLVAWSGSADREALRTPTRWSRDPAEDDASFASFAEVSEDGFFFGWSEAVPPAGLFAEPVGERAVSYQFNPAQPTALTLRVAEADDWIRRPLSAGYAAAIACSRSTSYGHAPFARPFFESLRRGWTLAEAVMTAMPMLAEGFFLCGDPLLTLRTPRIGWDVFGPFASTGDLDPEAPAARLPAASTSWPLPVNGAEAPQSRLIVHRSGASDESPCSFAWIPVASGGEHVTMRTAALQWPVQSGWPVRGIDGRLEFAVLWATLAPATPPDTAQLQQQAAEGGPVETVYEANVAPHATSFVVRLDRGQEALRYRWRLLRGESELAASAWSRWIDASAAQEIPLTILESSS